MVFCFVQKFFFGPHKSSNIYFLSRIFFPEFNIRLYDKNFGNQNIFLEEKTHNPHFKLNGRSLIMNITDILFIWR